ncbi:pyridoxal phosphate-dependent transferase [Hygrophoropsis aurantiaca]|uniref:Pyridoxal phosphate-dependent transferase n=1 Tax=Hygrophoropsis aurantiaca TaxID=72124 RepID=A0ACB8AGM2_9AGAM|nr:pyridoxal phosphate-dependent transferase [Hygrophoropsis aurantiaca]
MSHLYRNLRIHQIFGANTDVGKTIITTALVKASALNLKNVFYLKPVSTGAPQDADDQHIKHFAGAYKDLIQTKCLFRYSDPVSPHLAVKLASKNQNDGHSTPSDETFITAIADYIRRCSVTVPRSGHMYVETAGGVHSPTLMGTTQADSYRPLFLPTLLIGDSKLGGISSTISAYESLILRGYIIDAVILFREDYYRNSEYLIPYFAERGVYATDVESPPERVDDVTKDYSFTEDYYAKIVPTSCDSTIFDTLQHLDDAHIRRLDKLDSMPKRTIDAIWWPFVQHGMIKTEKDVTVIDSAWSDFFSIYEPSSKSPLSFNEQSLLKPQLDGSASWWTQALGHSHPSLALAAANAAGRYGHVMFPQATHFPALQLAERLVHVGPGKGWASRAFFSDNGSTAMEVALKMALRSFSVNSRHPFHPSEKKNLGIIGLKGSYHGDTIGAMDASEEGVYTCEWHQGRGYWFDPPTVSMQKGSIKISLPTALSTTSQNPSETFKSLSHVYDVNARLDTPLAILYRNHIERTLQDLKEHGHKLAALVLEPLVMGAGGMIFVDPLFQRLMVEVVRDPKIFQFPLPVIFDEVFVGLYRLGHQSSAPLLRTNPDISVYAKILTGGLLPMGITLASDHIFQAFNSSNKTDALLHGHSYTAHAIGCQVANTTLDIVEQLVDSQPWAEAQRKWESEDQDVACKIWSFWDPNFVDSMSHLPAISEVMALGTVLVIKLQDNAAGYASQSAQVILESIKESNTINPTVSAAPGGAPFGIHYRTLGNVAYFMTSLNTPRATIESVENRIWEALSNPTK